METNISSSIFIVFLYPTPNKLMLHLIFFFPKMETCFIILIFLCISAFIKTFINLINSYKNQTYKLPPGPSKLPIISKFLLVRKSLVELETIIRTLHSKYGPLITLPIGSRPAIIIADRFLIHQALIQNSAVFQTGPQPLPLRKSIVASSITSTLPPMDQRGASCAVTWPLRSYLLSQWDLIGVLASGCCKFS